MKARQHCPANAATVLVANCGKLAARHAANIFGTASASNDVAIVPRKCFRLSISTQMCIRRLTELDVIAAETVRIARHRNATIAANTAARVITEHSLPITRAYPMQMMKVTIVPT
jgi:hypothetical protein